jgi:hypothetical protein
MKNKKHQAHETSVTETRDFAGTIVEEKDGTRSLKIRSEAWYRENLRRFKVGEHVTLYISNKKPRRSEQQNRYYWNYLTEICKETGEESPERLHNLFKGLFLTTSIDQVFGHKVRTTRSTTSLSTQEFNEYITQIERETGILPPPPGNFFETYK